tara:strand:+ start:7091 stop:7333 length:243 start_codon:yes stop_codon:yes gene_type:complete
MRTHHAIIVEAGGYQAAAAKIDPTDTALPGRIRFWMRRDSIPADQWNAVVGAGLSTLKELADAAEAKRAANDAGPQEQAA